MVNSQKRVSSPVRNTSVVAAGLCTLSFVLKLISAIIGRSSIQKIDCVRSLIETTAVVVWCIFCLKKDSDLTGALAKRLTYWTRWAFILSGICMLCYSVMRYLSHVSYHGALWFGILVSLVGSFNNFWMSMRYFRNSGGSESVKVQGRLLLLKSLADLGVALTLIILVVIPGWQRIREFELVTSILLSFALIVSGVFYSGRNNVSGEQRER
ncbi:hypothetical protein [Butyrivibrio sp. AE2032]|uniref:hypothetical protein n=1 Tax=Butyrivibrio sp. AE2032 TaxID=1458463 RepID=UPI00054F06FC|nr:hypothetical protein [Butyrivibrio sp. AE2032]